MKPTLADDFAALGVKLPLKLLGHGRPAFDADDNYAHLTGDAAPLAVVGVNFHDPLVAALQRRLDQAGHRWDCKWNTNKAIGCTCDLAADEQLLADIAAARKEADRA